MIPTKRHKAVGKESGKTNHIERFNNTMRQGCQWRSSQKQKIIEKIEWTLVNLQHKCGKKTCFLPKKLSKRFLFLYPFALQFVTKSERACIMIIFNHFKRTFFSCLLLLAVLVLAGDAIASRGLQVTIKTATGKQIGMYKESHALVIGVSDYEMAGWSDLESIPAELQKLESALKRKGFSVTKVMDPNARQLENAFRNFIDQYGFDPDNRLLFFYSGHGYTRKKWSQGVFGTDRCTRSA